MCLLKFSCTFAFSDSWECMKTHQNALPGLLNDNAEQNSYQMKYLPHLYYTSGFMIWSRLNSLETLSKSLQADPHKYIWNNATSGLCSIEIYLLSDAAVLSESLFSLITSFSGKFYFLQGPLLSCEEKKSANSSSLYSI